MTLADYQRDFRAWLVNAEAPAAARLGIGPGLAVYQNTYRVQLVECLEQSFACVKTLVGDEAFRAAAIAHIDRMPPNHWTIDAYPSRFPESLIAHYPVNPDLHEIAWIELALADAFVAADAEAMIAFDPGAIDWNRAQLVLAPSLRLAPATTNAFAVWSALVDQGPAPESAMLAELSGLITWRQGLTSFVREIDSRQYRALCAVQGGQSFGELCDMLVAELGEADGVERAGTYLRDWMASAIVVAIDDRSSGSS
jgi:hypothetical protein